MQESTLLSAHLIDESKVQKTRTLLTIADLKKENERMKERMAEFFKTVKLPMALTMEDFTDVQVQADLLEADVVKRIVIGAFQSSRQIKDDAIRKIQKELSRVVGGSLKVSVAIYETTR